VPVYAYFRRSLPVSAGRLLLFANIETPVWADFNEVDPAKLPVNKRATLDSIN